MWYDDIADFDKDTWTFLKAELDAMTYNRFTPFFCKQVLCCDKLYEDFRPWINMNMKFLKDNHSFVFGGSIMERQGETISVGGMSKTTSSAHGILTGRNIDNNPLINSTLIRLCEKYGLTYAAPRTKSCKCMQCGSCEKDECWRCGGDEC